MKTFIFYYKTADDLYHTMPITEKTRRAARYSFNLVFGNRVQLSGIYTLDFYNKHIATA